MYPWYTHFPLYINRKESIVDIVLLEIGQIQLKTLRNKAKIFPTLQILIFGIEYALGKV